MSTDVSEALKQLARLREDLPRMEAALKERALQEAVDGGAAVVLRPFSIRHPLKGECDAWFGLAYHHWLELRRAGFKGFFTPGDPATGRATIMIIVDEAIAFLRARAAAQEGMFEDRSVPPEALTARRKRREEAAV